MNAETLNAVLDEFTTMLAPKVAAAMKRNEANPNELLTVRQIAKELRLGYDKTRLLVHSGALRRAKDIVEIRVSRRELERYTAGHPR